MLSFRSCIALVSSFNNIFACFLIILIVDNIVNLSIFSDADDLLRYLWLFKMCYLLLLWLALKLDQAKRKEKGIKE